VTTGLSRPAELAYIAARAATEGASAVEFRVRHVAGGQFVGNQLDRSDQPDEAVRFCAAGIETAAAIWPSTEPPVTDEMVSVRNVSGALSADSGLCWTGSAVLNPAFLYGSARRTEILVSFGDRAWRPSLRDTRMLTWIISQLAGAAVECTNGPIMLLQSPVSPFREAVGSNRGDGSGELVRPAEGSSLRMSISIDPAQPRRLLMFEERVHSFATENGLGLRIADRRANRIRGEWFKVHDFDGDLFERRRDELFRGVPEDSPTTAFVLTIVGPARVGSTLAVVRALDASNIGVLTYASESLAEMSISHILIPIAPVRLERAAGATSAADPLVAGLRRLASDCGLTPRSSAAGLHSVNFTPALGYKALRSEPAQITFRSGKGEPFALWVACDVPYRRITEEQVAEHLLNALQGKVATASLAYLRCHRTADDRVRARAKIAISLDAAVKAKQRAESLSRICAEAQDLTRRSLAATQGLGESELGIRIAWREKWLGAFGLGT
jgi:hypothetical protein